MDNQVTFSGDTVTVVRPKSTPPPWRQQRLIVNVPAKCYLAAYFIDILAAWTTAPRKARLKLRGRDGQSVIHE